MTNIFAGLPNQIKGYSLRIQVPNKHLEMNCLLIFIFIFCKWKGCSSSVPFQCKNIIFNWVIHMQSIFQPEWWDALFLNGNLIVLHSGVGVVLLRKKACYNMPEIPTVTTTSFVKNIIFRFVKNIVIITMLGMISILWRPPQYNSTEKKPYE